MLFFRKFQGGFRQSQTTSVRGYQSHFTIAERKGNAVQHVAGRIRGNGIFRPADTVTQHILLHLVHSSLLKRRQFRKFIRRKAVQFKLGAAAFHSSLVALVDIHLDFGFRKFADDAHQLFSGQGHGAFTQHICGNHASNAYIKISSRKTYLAVFSFNLDIGKNGQRRLGRHDAGNLSQPVEKYLLGNGKLHVSVLLSASHLLISAFHGSSHFSVKP